MAKTSETRTPEPRSTVTLNEEDLQQTAAAGSSPLIKKSLKTQGTIKAAFHGSDFNAVNSSGN